MQGIGRCKYCCVFLTLFLYISISVNTKNCSSHKFQQTFYFHRTLFSYAYISTIKKRLNRLKQKSIYHYDDNSSMRFSKTNWLNFHRHYCFSLLTNRFNTITIGDSIAAGLNRYRSVCMKYLEPIKTLNCGLGGDRVQNILWRSQNLPVMSSLKNVVIFCGTNNLFQYSPRLEQSDFSGQLIGG